MDSVESANQVEQTWLGDSTRLACRAAIPAWSTHMTCPVREAERNRQYLRDQERGSGSYVGEETRPRKGEARSTHGWDFAMALAAGGPLPALSATHAFSSDSPEVDDNLENDIFAISVSHGVVPGPRPLSWWPSA